MTQPERSQTTGEEIANCLSHGIGLLGAIVAAVVLVLDAVRHSDRAGLVGAAVFSTTMVLVYLTSTLYHAVPENRAKSFFRTLDHGAIYLLIAGTYTPFALSVLRSTWSLTMLGLEWGLAIAGVLLNSFWGLRYPRLSTWLYLAMGWLVLFRSKCQWPGFGGFWQAASATQPGWFSMKPKVSTTATSSGTCS